jgi:hypothetical protein
MDPLIVSAQFAAYVWFTEHATSKLEADAMAFANEKWPRFYPLAHEGLGRLLAKIAGNNAAKRHRLKLAKTLTSALRKQSRSRTE